MANKNLKECTSLALSILDGKLLKRSLRALSKCPICRVKLDECENFLRCPKCGRDWLKARKGIYTWKNRTKNDPIGEWVEWTPETPEKVQFT